MRTFHNMRGICATKGVVNSDGEFIPETAVEMVVLFNTDYFSVEEMQNFSAEDLFNLEKEGKIVIVPRFIAENLADEQ